MWNEISRIIQKIDDDIAGIDENITEERTKQFLIEPILSALGWSLTDPNEVQREYKKVVDYALFGKRITLFLEAKRLGRALDPAMNQVLQYAIQKNIRPDFVITTDGVIWNCVSMRYQTTIFSLNLRTANEQEQSKFLLLSKQSIDNGKLTNYTNQIRTEAEVLAYIKRNSERIADDIKAYDSSFDRKSIIDYLTALTSRSSIIIKVNQPATPAAPSKSKTKSTSSSSSLPSYLSSPSSAKPYRLSKSRANEYDISLLNQDYLALVANRLDEMKNHIGKDLYVRFGITGKWETPNYQVETENGSQIWTFRGTGRAQGPFLEPGKSFNRRKITYKKYSREDILKIIE